MHGGLAKQLTAYIGIYVPVVCSGGGGGGNAVAFAPYGGGVFNAWALSVGRQPAVTGRGTNETASADVPNRLVPPRVPPSFPKDASNGACIDREPGDTGFKDPAGSKLSCDKLSLLGGCNDGRLGGWVQVACPSTCKAPWCRRAPNSAIAVVTTTTVESDQQAVFEGDGNTASSDEGGGAAAKKALIIVTVVIFLLVVLATAVALSIFFVRSRSRSGDASLMDIPKSSQTSPLGPVKAPKTYLIRERLPSGCNAALSSNGARGDGVLYAIPVDGTLSRPYSAQSSDRSADFGVAVAALAGRSLGYPEIGAPGNAEGAEAEAGTCAGGATPSPTTARHEHIKKRAVDSAYSIIIDGKPALVEGSRAGYSGNVVAAPQIPEPSNLSMFGASVGARGYGPASAPSTSQTQGALSMHSGVADPDKAALSSADHTPRSADVVELYSTPDASVYAEPSAIRDDVYMKLRGSSETRIHGAVASV